MGTKKIITDNLEATALTTFTDTPSSAPLTDYDIANKKYVDDQVAGLTSSLTQGSVVFAGAAGLLSQDNSNFYWDDTNNRLGLGLTNPNQQLEMTGNFRVPNTTFASQNGIIYKAGNPFIHNFNYGDNGTVTTDGYNTFVGENAGNLTMGATATQVYHSSRNTGVGYSALIANTTGAENIGIGSYALFSNTTGLENTGVGERVLYSVTTGSANTALGYKACYTTTASNNTGIGHQALLLASSGTGNNTGVGYNSLYNVTTGANNTAIGYRSGKFIADGSTANQTSGTSVYVGADTKASANGDSNEIVIGYNTTGNGSNTTTIGNSSVTQTYIEGKVLAEISNGGASSLVVKNNATNPNYQVDVDASSAVLVDTNNHSVKVSSVDLTLDITASGANGLDTGSEASSTWYYIWVIYNPTTNTTAGLLSTSYSSPTMPSGYTYKQMVGAVRNNASSNFLLFRQFGNQVFYEGRQQITTGLNSTSYALVDVSSIIPTSTNKIESVLFGAIASASTPVVWISVDGTNAQTVFTASSVTNTVGAIDELYGMAYSNVDYVPLSGNNVYYKIGASSITLYGRAWRWNF